MTEKKYDKNLVSNPVRELGGALPEKVKGREYPLNIYLSNELVPGSNVYMRWGWVWEIPNPNPHTLEHIHNYDEIIVHIGRDHDDPENLGAEIEFSVGGEPLLINKTSALFVPRGVKHGPITWKKFEKPHIQMSIMLGAGSVTDLKAQGEKDK
jgi:hypothetical protein